MNDVIDLKSVKLNEAGKQFVAGAMKNAQGQPYIVGNAEARLKAFNLELGKLLDSYGVVLIPVVQMQPGQLPIGSIQVGIRKEPKADA